MMAAAFASGNSTVKDKIVRAYISAVNPEQWSSSKQYAGPQPDGTTDVVYWHPSGMNNYPHVYLAKRPSHNRAPTT
jgi:hypothetical protein